MNTKFTVRLIGAILIILIIVVGSLLWSRNHAGTKTFVSTFGYSISLPSNYHPYEDKNGMIAFPKLVFNQASTTLDYHASYGANSEGISIVALIPDQGLTDLLFDAMTQNLATSTEILPQGALLMRSGQINASGDTSPEGSYRGMNYAFKTERGVYLFNVFSTDPNGTAHRTAIAKKILASFREITEATSATATSTTK